MGTEKEYFAFISYKREDEKWAKWLQHKLEHYKLPSNLNGRADLPNEIRPIFKDTSELTPGNLPEQIQEALNLSKNLIVICSPRSAKSEWVNREVETFIAMGRIANIIPFIIEGSPFAKDSKEECFPKSLRELPKEQEILGANINEMGRDAAAVKVVSKMFNLKFDTLWQRYEREKKKKRLFVIGTCFFVAIMAATIVAVIFKQKSDIYQANWEMMENRARSVENEICDLIKNNDCYTACRLALYLLPNDMLTPDKPYLEEIEVALRKALNENNAIIPRDNNGRGIATFSPDGKLIAECGYWASTIIWDANSGALIQELGKYYYGDENSDYPQSVIFSKDGRSVLTHYRQGGVTIWNIDSGDERSRFSSYDQIPEKILAEFDSKFKAEDKGHYEETLVPKYTADRKRYLITDSISNIVIKNVQSDALVKTYNIEGVKKLKYSNDGKQIVGIARSGCYIMDFATGNINKYVDGAIDLVYDKTNTFGLFFKGKLIRTMDWENNMVVSKITLPKDVRTENIHIYFNANGELIIVETNYFETLVYDTRSGKMLKRFDIVTEGDFKGAISNNNLFYLTVGCGAGGRLYDFKSSTILCTYDGSCVDAIAISDDGGKSAIGTKENGIILYNNSNENLTIPLNKESEQVNSMSFSRGGNLLVSSHNDGLIKVWNTKTGTLMCTYQGNNGKTICTQFSPDNRNIISVNEDGNINVWEYLPLQELMDRARERFKNNPLTENEKKKYFIE